MKKNSWVEKSLVAVTVCDKKGTILEMNAASAKTFAKDGGKKLIGKSVLACHPEKARTKLEKMLKTKRPNVYTIEKEGRKKMICQFPWYDRNGRYSGLVELSFPIPSKIPHFVR